MIKRLFSNFVQVKTTPISFQFYIFNNMLLEIYSSLLRDMNQFYIDFYSLNKGVMNILINDMNCSDSKKNQLIEDLDTEEAYCDDDWSRKFILLCGDGFYLNIRFINFRINSLVRNGQLYVW